MSFNKLLFKLHFYCILDISEAVLFISTFTKPSTEVTDVQFCHLWWTSVIHKELSTIIVVIF